MMLANYGYQDASGSYFITLDTDLCDGCCDCVSACPKGIFKVLNEDPNDPMRDDPVAVVDSALRKKIKYECSECKPSEQTLPLLCVKACSKVAISHSW